MWFRPRQPGHNIEIWFIMTIKINLNSDMGESFGAWTMGDDDTLLTVVKSANIACGFHGGDPMVMDHTVRAALANGVSLGAHPSFQDLHGFGRREMKISHAEAENITAYQIGALQGITAAAGGQVTHVKPHGAINNMACRDRALADALARAVKAVDPNLIMLAPTGSELLAASRAINLPTASEVFADRTYGDDGNLTPRGNPDAMVHDPDQAVANVLAMIRDQQLVSTSGKEIPAEVQSICVHGDGPTAIALARAVRAGIEAEGIAIAPLPEVIAA